MGCAGSFSRQPLSETETNQKPRGKSRIIDLGCWRKHLQCRSKCSVTSVSQFQLQSIQINSGMKDRAQSWATPGLKESGHSAEALGQMEWK